MGNKQGTGHERRKDNEQDTDSYRGDDTFGLTALRRRRADRDNINIRRSRPGKNPRGHPPAPGVSASKWNGKKPPYDITGSLDNASFIFPSG